MLVARSMARRIAMLVTLTVAGALLWAPLARAAGDSEEQGSRITAEPPSAPAPAVASEPTESAPRPPVPEAIAAVGPVRPPLAWGVGLRARWVSVPSWLLGLFTKHNIPLFTFGHFGIEAFRRNGDFDLAFAFSYQNMSPRDGNWLGDGHDPAVDTKFLQFRGFSIYSADISFIWHPMLSSWFGLHLGAGLGVAVVRGDLYLFPSEGCDSTNLDNLNACHPPGFTCANGVCTSPVTLTRSPSRDVLPVVPLINLVAGVDFRLPNVKGWEAKLEAGFYDALFFGFGVAYTF
jgi:hypothetical protein